VPWRTNSEPTKSSDRLASHYFGDGHSTAQNIKITKHTAVSQQSSDMAQKRASKNYAKRGMLKT